jgi:hypothetical protein
MGFNEGRNKLEIQYFQAKGKITDTAGVEGIEVAAKSKYKTYYTRRS